MQLMAAGAAYFWVAEPSVVQQGDIADWFIADS